MLFDKEKDEWQERIDDAVKRKQDVNEKELPEVLEMNLGSNGVSELGSEVLFARFSSFGLLVGVESFISCTNLKTLNI